MSFSFGSRGASVSIGKRGTYLNTSIPGTGLYMREKLGNSKQNLSNKIQSNKINMTITVSISDDGTIEFQDSDGNPLPDHLISVAKKQQGEILHNLIKKKCAEINDQIEAIGEIHLYTPAPDNKPQYLPKEFLKPKPQSPTLLKVGFFDKLFGNKHEKIEKENQNNQKKYMLETDEWEKEKLKFIETEILRKKLIETDIYVDIEAMEIFLEESLQDIVWPRETVISAEILKNGMQVFIDVDLPEIEDIPNKKATIPQRGYKLSVKEMSMPQIQQLYMRHVHGIGFRIIGETFWALPNTEEVVLSAYSQRSNSLSAVISEEYLYSVQVSRCAWSNINFQNLERLNIVETLEQFNLIREMSKTGKFKPIEPYSPAFIR